uniref:Arylsulphatase A n=1 Tax=uncultured sludge bacterium TaxID=641485 RepID=E0WCJ7_9BACT|nr:arylsulphatase A [uncultured sludge bacterium]
MVLPISVSTMRATAMTPLFRLLILFTCLAWNPSSSGSSPGKPNFVLILLDNIGKEWFGSEGSLEHRTPHIDQLAREGVRFENCYASPICSVSRVLLLTGRYPFRTGWTFHHDAGIYGGGNFDWAREQTFARILRDQGYATGISGKWQISNFNDPGQENSLREHGFDEFLITPGGRQDSKYWDPMLNENGVNSLRKGTYAPDVFVNFAIEFMRHHREQPFMLYLPLTLAHKPFTPTPDHTDPNASPQELFANSVEYADRLVGKVAKSLDELGLRDNTVLFVTSDNGNEDNISARTQSGLVPGKIYTMAEQSINMPLIVNCPRLIPGGRSGSLADYSDLLPTMAELAGIPLPTEHPIDGQSFAAWLRGNDAKPPRTWIHTALQDERVIRNERFKLYASAGTPDKFFDLKNDPQETRNLISSSENDVSTARRQLESILKSFPEDAPMGFEPQSITAREFRAKKQAGSTEKPEAQ